MHAYQSWLWNSAVSHRVARHGISHPVEGDLVMPAARDESLEAAELASAGEGGEWHAGCGSRLWRLMLACKCLSADVQSWNTLLLKLECKLLTVVPLAGHVVCHYISWQGIARAM